MHINIKVTETQTGRSEDKTFYFAATTTLMHESAILDLKVGAQILLKEFPLWAHSSQLLHLRARTFWHSKYK